MRSNEIGRASGSIVYVDSARVHEEREPRGGENDRERIRVGVTAI